MMEILPLEIIDKILSYLGPIEIRNLYSLDKNINYRISYMLSCDKWEKAVTVIDITTFLLNKFSYIKIDNILYRIANFCILDDIGSFRMYDGSVISLSHDMYFLTKSKYNILRKLPMSISIY